MLCVMQIMIFMLYTYGAHSEFYENSRCSCICPGLGTNKSKLDRALYQDNHVSPEKCNCIEIVLPRIMNKFNGSQHTYCVQCDCRFETRNTMMVMVVIISLLAIIVVLILYMACLHILQKIVKRRDRVTHLRLNNEEQRLLNTAHLDSSDEGN